MYGPANSPSQLHVKYQEDDDEEYGGYYQQDYPPPHTRMHYVEPVSEPMVQLPVAMVQDLQDMLKDYHSRFPPIPPPPTPMPSSVPEIAPPPVPVP